MPIVFCYSLLLFFLIAVFSGEKGEGEQFNSELHGFRFFGLEQKEGNREKGGFPPVNVFNNNSFLCWWKWRMCGKMRGDGRD